MTPAAPSASSLVAALQRWGFRPLTRAEASRGPFTQDAASHPYLLRQAERLTMAFLHEEERVEGLLERLSLGAWGYDVALGGDPRALTAVHELHVVPRTAMMTLADPLTALGFERRGASWAHLATDTPLPDAADGEAWPAFAWIGSDPQGPPGADRWVRGTYLSPLPAGLHAEHCVRGYHFVAEAAKTRRVPRRRLLCPGEVAALDEAMALSLGDG